MNQLKVQHLAFLLLNVSMVVVGGMGLTELISSGPWLFAALLAAIVEVSFSAGRLSTHIG